jgi:hypothetical protein
MPEYFTHREAPPGGQWLFKVDRTGFEVDRGYPIDSEKSTKLSRNRADCVRHRAPLK